jgi:hypothetical protein
MVIHIRGKNQAAHAGMAGAIFMKSGLATTARIMAIFAIICHD